MAGSDENPFWKVIREELDGAPAPAFHFLPPTHFEAAVASAPKLHPHERENILRTYNDAGIFCRCLGRGRWDLESLATCYHFVSVTDLGSKAGHAARIASEYGPKMLAGFSASTALDGFKEALESWYADIWREGSWQSMVTWVHESSLLARDDDAKKFWLHEALRQADSAEAFLEQVRVIGNRGQDRGRKREGRGLDPREPAKYREFIRLFWVPAALWCRTDSGIAHVLFKREAVAGAFDARIERDISDLRMKLRAKFNRHAEHEELVDKAESDPKGLFVTDSL